MRFIGIIWPWRVSSNLIDMEMFYNDIYNKTLLIESNNWLTENASNNWLIWSEFKLVGLAEKGNEVNR